VRFWGNKNIVVVMDTIMINTASFDYDFFGGIARESELKQKMLYGNNSNAYLRLFKHFIAKIPFCYNYGIYTLYYTQHLQKMVNRQKMRKTAHIPSVRK
jgi:hypothetical protein